MNESPIKFTWKQRLQICQNQKQGIALRLNSGCVMVCRKQKQGCPGSYGNLYKVELCPPGTADLVLVQNAIWIETKKTNGKQKADQINFEQLVTSMGMPYLCPDTTDTSLLEEILK